MIFPIKMRNFKFWKMPKLLNFSFPKWWYFLKCGNTELKTSSKIIFYVFEKHRWAVVGQVRLGFVPWAFLGSETKEGTQERNQSSQISNVELVAWWNIEKIKAWRRHPEAIIDFPVLGRWRSRHGFTPPWSVGGPRGPILTGREEEGWSLINGGKRERLG